ncbi:ATP-grasp domain-containing protein [Streptomyces sp. AK02-01A]|uniref:ATP-grasp domain-containing protein n=1 Tax=Streptomyces sp. AK02-01A TaxID=3028648 RepID=UPI0029A5AD4A|nr:ATP-grasp domain-containing protein [Streptomyces sp. AK02-01A]MDX3854904.1 ATP-grasp domain-containing protein [Streptomyces sp. AK02-01A]
MDAEAYRGYCLENVAAAYDVVLITGTEPTWERRFLTDWEVADPTDQAALSTAGRALAARHQLAGVVTWTEWYLIPVARLARQLGLPADPPEVMRACRNKATSRTLFARHGVPSAASMTTRSLLEAALAAETIGYPVVLKPASRAASIGVIRADRAEELPAAWEFAAAGASQDTKSPQVLVEEYLDGPEVSVECVTHRGTTSVVAVTRKTVSPPPFFEEMAHSVDAADPLLTTVAPAATAAIKALGITDGVSHVEMRLVDDRPRLIEVNGRIAGDMIGHLVRLATGIDLPRAAADIACGRTPDLTPTQHQAAAIRLLYPDTSGVLADLRLDETGEEPWLERVRFQRRPGDEVLLPQDGGDMFTARLGFLITTAPTGDLAQARAQAIQRRLAVSVAPLT